MTTKNLQLDPISMFDSDRGPYPIGLDPVSITNTYFINNSDS